MTSTIEKPSTLNPLSVANQKIISAKAASREQGEKLRRAWTEHRNSTPTISASATMDERTRLETAHTNLGNRLRSASQNFRPEVFVSSLLDTDGNQPLLVASLRWLREEYAAVLTSKAAIPAVAAPKAKSGLITAIEGLLGSPVEPELAWPPPRARVVGGPWGEIPPLDVPADLDRLSAEVKTMDKGYEHLVGELNSCHSAILALTPTSRPSEPQRMDKGFVVPSRF